MASFKLNPASTKVRDVAALLNVKPHHSGGGIWVVRIPDPMNPTHVYTFGMEPGDVVGFDIDIDDEYEDFGELPVSANASAEDIAREIRSFLTRSYR